MNDFLGNLLARSRGAVEVVQPRLPAIFEPDPRGSGLLSERARDPAPDFEWRVESGAESQAPATAHPMESAPGVAPSVRHDPPPGSGKSAIPSADDTRPEHRAAAADGGPFAPQARRPTPSSLEPARTAEGEAHKGQPGEATDAMPGPRSEAQPASAPRSAKALTPPTVSPLQPAALRDEAPDSPELSPPPFAGQTVPWFPAPPLRHGDSAAAADRSLPPNTPVRATSALVAGTPRADKPDVTATGAAATKLGGEVPGPAHTRAEAAPDRVAVPKILIREAAEPPGATDSFGRGNGFPQPLVLRPAPNPQLSQSASASLVRITIGRVEVRAVFPEAAVQRPQPRPRTTLSLDDYLKPNDRARR